MEALKKSAAQVQPPAQNLYKWGALGLSTACTAVVIGARGGVGGALRDAATRLLPPGSRLIATSREADFVETTVTPDPEAGVLQQRQLADVTDELSIARLAKRCAEGPPLRLVLNASGLLHDGAMQPERHIRDLDPEALRRAFEVNSIGVALLIKHLLPVMPRRDRAIFATLSARVGSIGDNRLGGWYGYRASKAAQNMLIKCAAIEAARRHPELLMVALHPGTVRTDLSAPFTKRLPSSHAVFSPEQSASYLLRVLSSLTPEDTGGHFAWDGAPIPW